MAITGSCHCGKTVFRVDTEIPAQLTRSTCSFCAKRGALMAYCEPDQFHPTLLAAEYAVYRWQARQVAHHFCTHCGCATFSDSPAFEPDAKWDGSTHRIGVNARLFDDFDAVEHPDVSASRKFNKPPGQRNDRSLWQHERILLVPACSRSQRLISATSRKLARINRQTEGNLRSDHPTLDDRLKRVAAVKAKARQIMNCDAPQAFGVHGDWGSGKTSFLRQLRFHLDGTRDGCKDQPSADLSGGTYNGRVVTIWFDAWRYQHDPAPVIALLQEMRRQFSTWAKSRNKASKLIEVGVRSLLNSLDDIAKLLKLEAVPMNPKGIQEIGERWEKEHLENRLGIDTVQDFLEQAVATILKELVDSGNDGRLVVFIDDLDRCSADAAFRLLEGLKVYLSLKNCVFVLAMNQQLVVDAIAACMPKELSPTDAKLKEGAIRVRAEAYLEKLCTDIERLTPPSDTRDLLRGWIDDAELSAKLVVALTDATGVPIRCLPPNPRRIKALANLLLRWWPEIKTLAGQEVDNIRALLVVAYVYQFHSELFQRWQFNPSFFTHMANWSTKVWPVTTGGGLQDWPVYFAGLKLPEHTDAGSEESPTPQASTRSTFPDPYAPDMFWIAPLIRHAGLTEDIIEPVMNAVVSGAVAAA